MHENQGKQTTSRFGAVPSSIINKHTLFELLTAVEASEVRLKI